MTNEISGTVSIVDVAAHQVIAAVLLEEGEGKPVGVTVSPDGREVYVANGGTGTVSVINTATGAVEADIQVGRRPWGITVSPDGRHAYTATGCPMMSRLWISLVAGW